MKTLMVILLVAFLVGCGGSSHPAAITPTPTITGNWSGSATSVLGGTALVSGKLSEGAHNADGTIAFSGSLALTNSCISNLLIVNGLIAGNSFALTGPVNDGSTLSVTATLNANDTAIQGTYKESGGSLCLQDNGQFTLSKTP